MSRNYCVVDSRQTPISPMLGYSDALDHLRMVRRQGKPSAVAVGTADDWEIVLDYTDSANIRTQRQLSKFGGLQCAK